MHVCAKKLKVTLKIRKHFHWDIVTNNDINQVAQYMRIFQQGKAVPSQLPRAAPQELSHYIAVLQSRTGYVLLSAAFDNFSWGSKV